MDVHDLHAYDPYRGFNPDPFRLDLHGWNSGDPLFEQLVKEVKSSLTVEVGCWLGAATVTLGNALKEHCPGGKLLCVDTWLGALEFWTDKADGSRYGKLDHLHGYPRVYYQFLANVMKSGLQDVVIPFPNTSAIAARWLRKAGLRPQLIYVDASHDYEDVLLDLELYWEVLAPGGVLFGDDYTNREFPGVRTAVEEFTRPGARGGLYPNDRFEDAGNKWVIRKAKGGTQ